MSDNHQSNREKIDMREIVRLMRLVRSLRLGGYVFNSFHYDLINNTCETYYVSTKEKWRITMHAVLNLYINLFNHHKDLKRDYKYFSLIFRCGNWSTERLSIPFKLTQPVSHRAKIPMQAMCLYFTAFAGVERRHNPFIHSSNIHWVYTTFQTMF